MEGLLSAQFELDWKGEKAVWGMMDQEKEREGIRN